MRPQVSIVMPSYNYGRYLRDAIEGVLTQSHSSIELIITDDCSTDESRYILTEYERLDRRVIVLFQKQNRGLASARNSALAASSGEFIAMCDADDVWLAHKLDTQIEWFRRNPELGLVHSDAKIIDAAGSLTGDNFSSILHGKAQRTSGMLFDELCRRNFLCVPTVIVRRQALEYAGGFDERLRSLEDWVCWTRIARRYPFGYIEEPLVYYRIHNASLSSNRSGMAENRVKAIRLLLDSIPHIPLRARAQLLYALGMSQLEKHDGQSAIQAFRQAMAADPTHFQSALRWCQTIAGVGIRRALRRA